MAFHEVDSPSEKLIIEASMLAGTVLNVDWPVVVRKQGDSYVRQFGAACKYIFHREDIRIQRSWWNGQYFIGDWEFDSREDAERFAKAVMFMNAKYERLQNLWRFNKAYRIARLVGEANGQPLNVLVDDKELEDLRAEFEEHGFRVRELYFGY
jgi:hypothetical protein